MKARILIIVENLPVPFDRRVWAEATALKSAGYEVSVICPVGPEKLSRRETLDGIRILRHPLPVERAGKFGYALEYGAALMWQSYLVALVWWRQGFDVIHACNPPDTIFLVALPYKIIGTKFVFDHHDLNPELFEAKFGRRGLLWRVLVMLERATFWAADISLATNASYRQIAIQRGRMSPDNVFVVRSGPKIDKVRPVPTNENWRNGRNHMVAYVGVIGEQEGLDLLLQSIEHLTAVHRRSDVQFVVVGSGPHLPYIKQLCHTLGLDEFVTFTGRVGDDVLLQILSSADVCVNPDRPNALNDKSTMNKIMEYMAVGKPIVQYDVTEGRVSAERASLYATSYADFADKIIQLIEDRQLARQMGEYGFARVRSTLSWDNEAPKLLAAYKKLLG